MRKKINQNNLFFYEHLKIFRNRLLIWAGVFLSVFAVCMAFSADILNFILELSRSSEFNFSYLYPQEIFLQYIGISFLMAFVLSLPVFIYEIAVFIAPVFQDMHGRAKFVFFISVVLSIALFYLGMLFCGMFVFPLIIQYLMKINAGVDAVGMISIENYMSLLGTMVILFGILFEIPIIIFVLAKFHIIDVNMLLRWRKLVIIVSFVLAAIITPPDVISQCLVALPTVILYQISIWLVRLFVVRKNKSEGGVQE